jgi:hypothetical protein
MSTTNKPLFLTILFSLFALGVYGQDNQSESAGAVLSVNDLAAKATQHLGDVRLVGVVAAVSQGSGFTLVDKREYADCGISCIAEPGTKKIPVRWSGDAPRLEQTVRVDGTLQQTDKGLSLVAKDFHVL